ncbi:MAG: PQQ-binding-like beta-propeller repeat protein [Bacteroidales bacterium]|nr:PQQ-binding-like beta-propeller repeat protein [Bacteroidales bacterium]MCF8404751.1 PQQ-binding-like beta-propeller repeat protein [Bacteroidales bacterium]
MKPNLILFLFLIFLQESFSQLPMQWNVGVGGNSPRNCLSTAYGPQQANILWEGSLYALRGYQTFIDGSIIAASRRFNYNDLLHGAVIVTHDLHTGDTLWTAELPVQNPANESFSQVKGLKNGHVYATRADGIQKPSPLYALDMYTGEVVWQSPAMMTTSYSEDLSFAENGDIIIGNYFDITRVNKNNGEVMWSADKTTPSSDGAHVAVYNNRIYAWEASPYGPKISVFKLDDGSYLYSTEAVSAGLVQQTGLMVGPDGTIYAPRTQNNPTTDYFVSYTDTGSEFIENWRLPYGYAIWSSSAVGPDGSVYSYSTDGEVMRLDPANGDILNTSEQIISAYPAGPKMAIGADGILYVTNGEWGEEKLYSFNPDLSTRWMEDFTYTSIEGPSLAYDGTLVVCAGGTEMKVYAGNPVPQLFAEFKADTTTGSQPCLVNFTDLSQGFYTNINTWEWDFENDGIIDSYEQNPTFAFDQTGYFSVKLVISDGIISDTLIKEDYIFVGLGTGILERELDIHLYPNPFVGKIYISCNMQIDEVCIYDISGKEHISQKFTSRNIFLDNLGQLKSGSYLLEVKSAGRVHNHKLMKK